MAKNTTGGGRKPGAAPGSATPKSGAAPATPFPAAPETLHREGDRLWLPLRQEWRDMATPSNRWPRNGGPPTATGARAPTS